MNKIELESLTYQVINGKIHHFTFHQENRQVVDDVFKIIDQIYEIEGTDDMIYLLIDGSYISEIPLRYTNQKVKYWQDKQAVTPPSRSAVLFNQNPLMEVLLNMIIGYFNNKEASTQLFRPDNRQQAIEWLISE